MTDEPSYPGAAAPERTGVVRSLGLPLHVSEWGDPDGPPVLLCHGMFDHGRGFDLLAPLLAERFRVVAVDARGHGNSAWADAYTWLTDVLDVVNVLAWIGRPTRLVGHSKGGGVAIDAAMRAPDRVVQVVSLDGFGPPPEGFAIPGMPRDERTVPARFRDFLDARRAPVRARAYPTFEHLVERRRAQNPRLSRAWLHYFVRHGARETPGGWVWKADLRAARGFGPWTPEWLGPGWTALRVPMLAIVGSEPDTWGPLPESVIGPRLAYVPRLARATVAGAGHFVHMEQPQATARVLLDWLER